MQIDASRKSVRNRLNYEIKVTDRQIKLLEEAAEELFRQEAMIELLNEQVETYLAIASLIRSVADTDWPVGGKITELVYQWVLDRVNEIQFKQQIKEIPNEQPSQDQP